MSAQDEPDLEVNVEYATVGLSFVATAVVATTYALTVQTQEAEVPIVRVRRVLGLSEEAWAAAYEEAYEHGAMFRAGAGFQSVQLMCADAILSRAIGAPGRPKASAWEALRRRVFAESEPACCYCGSPDDLTIDHVVAVDLGGSNHPCNLVVACKTCNSAKGAKPWSAWYVTVRERYG